MDGSRPKKNNETDSSQLGAARFNCGGRPAAAGENSIKWFALRDRRLKFLCRVLDHYTPFPLGPGGSSPRFHWQFLSSAVRFFSLSVVPFTWCQLVLPHRSLRRLIGFSVHFWSGTPSRNRFVSFCVCVCVCCILKVCAGWPASSCTGGRRHPLARPFWVVHKREAYEKRQWTASELNRNRLPYAFSCVSRWWTSSSRLLTIDTSSSSSSFSRSFCASVFCQSAIGFQTDEIKKERNQWTSGVGRRQTWGRTFEFGYNQVKFGKKTNYFKLFLW